MTKLMRAIVLLVAVAASYMLQVVILPGIPYLVTVPNLLLITVFSTGFIFGSAPGLLIGLICGLLLDLLSVGVPGFYTLCMVWIGFIDGVLSRKLEAERIPLLFLLFLANEVVYHLYTFLFSFMLRKSFSLFPYLTEVFLPELVLSMVCFLLEYGLLIFISNRWNLKVLKG